MTLQTTTSLTQEQAVELSNEVIRLEAIIKEMKEKLKAYVEENGELIADDTVWKFQEAESWEFNDIKSFLKSLVIDGYTVDPYSLITVNKTKMDKLGLDESYISNFAKKKTTKRFVNRKK